MESQPIYNLDPISPNLSKIKPGLYIPEDFFIGTVLEYTCKMNISFLVIHLLSWTFYLDKFWNLRLQARHLGLFIRYLSFYLFGKMEKEEKEERHRL